MGRVRAKRTEYILKTEREEEHRESQVSAGSLKKH
jgi:hypothetical protein